MTDTAYQNGKGPWTLNVVFHGLWAFETRNGEILAHTAHEHEHKVKGGTWATPKDLGHGEHALQGVVPGNDNDFDRPKNPVVQNAALKHVKDRFCVVKLPPAKSVRSVRNVPVPAKGPAPFAGVHGQKLRPAEVSMVQVLIYAVADPAAVRLSGLAWTPEWNANIANLHIFAQPEEAVSKHHFQVAYKKLAALFDLDITPVTELFVPASDPGIPGLTAEHMKGLNERGPMPIGAAVSGSNCDALVIDNLSPAGKRP